MNLFIDNKSGAPIYEQLYTQIKNQILSGELQPEEAMPSIRGLARDLRISVITTKRADDYLFAVWRKNCGLVLLPRNGLMKNWNGMDLSIPLPEKAFLSHGKIQKSCGKSGCDRLNRIWKRLQHWQRAADFPKRTYRKC